VNWAVHLALATTQLIFASLPIAAKFVLPSIGPVGILFFRVTGSAVAFAAIRAFGATERITNRRDLWALAGLSLIGVVLNQLLFLEGTKRTTAINTNVLITTIPVFTLAIALLLRRERASGAKLGGIVLAAAGALYLIGLDRVQLDRGDTVGAALIVGCTLLYAGYLVLSKGLLQRYQPLTVVTHVFLFAGVIVLPMGLVALRDVNLAMQPARALVALAYIVVFPSIVAYFLSVWALRRTASSLVAMYVYLQPLVTAVAAPIILGERMTPRAGVAAVLIFAGLALATWGEQVAGQLGAAFRPPSEGV
jgi:drug/metabolite transporter (DMT)-like permease